MPSDKSSIIEKAQKLAAKGRLDQAIEEWQKLIAETPNDGNIYNTIGDLHLKANHAKEAIAAYLKGAETFKAAGFELKSIAVFKKIIKIDPARMDVYEKLADVHADRGLTGNAVEDYLRVAKSHIKSGDIRSALSVYRKLANLDPQNAGVRLKIAEMCQKEGLQKEAVEEYEKVLTIYQEQKKTAEAKEALDQILKIDPAYKSAALSGAPPEPGSIASAEAPGPLSEEAPPMEAGLERRAEVSPTAESEPVEIKMEEVPPQEAQAPPPAAESEPVGIERPEAERPIERPEAERLIERPEAERLIERPEEEVFSQEPPEELSAPESAPIEIKESEEAPSPPAPEEASGRRDRSAPASQPQKEESAAVPEISEATLQGHLTEAEVYIKYGLHSKAIEQLRMISELAPSREEPRLQLKDLYLKEGMTQKAVEEIWILARLYEKAGAEDKRSAILSELSAIDPEAARRDESAPAVADSDEPLGAVLPAPEEPSPLSEAEAEEAAPSEGAPEIERPGAERAKELQGIREKMVQVEEHLQKGQKDSAKKLLWKIMEENSSFTEARLKLLEIQEISQREKAAEKAPVDETFGSRPLDSANGALEASEEAGLEETSFEGLSEALDQSFSELVSNETSSEASEEASDDEKDSAIDAKGEPEEYVDLTSIFSEEIQEEKHEENEETIDFTGIGLEDAFKELQRGAQGQMNQEEFETHYNLGIAYKEMGLIPEAIKEFELAFQGDLRFLDASLMLAHCYQQRGMIDTGIEILQNALEDPRCDKKNILALKYELATFFQQKGVSDKARSLFEEIYRLDSQFRDIAAKIESFEKAPVPSAPEEAKPKQSPGPKKKGRVSYL